MSLPDFERTINSRSIPNPLFKRVVIQIHRWKPHEVSNPPWTRKPSRAVQSTTDRSEFQEPVFFQPTKVKGVFLGKTLEENSVWENWGTLVGKKIDENHHLKLWKSVGFFSSTQVMSRLVVWGVWWFGFRLHPRKWKGLGFLGGTPIRILNHRAPKPTIYHLLINWAIKKNLVV